MANSIAVISTHESLSNKIISIIEELGEDIDVYTATFDNAVILCRQLISNGTKIFISRGGNAKYLRKKLGCTVVDISHNLADYIDAFEKARNKKGKIGVFRYENRLDDLDVIGKLLSIDMTQYTFNNAKEAKEAAMRAASNGIVLGIGGVVTGKFAKQMGIEYIVIDSSRSSIINAINTAKQLLQVQEEEYRKAENYKIQMESYRAILNFSYNGIIAIDENCKIKAFNPIAERLLGISSDKAIGRNIKEILPNTELINVLQTGTAELNQIMRANGKLLYTNRVPICIDGKVKGVVATFEDVKRLQESEHEIRRKLHSKGLIAKYRFSDIIGSSPILKQTIDIAKSYARTSSTILIHGETGTGKELFAQSIHNFSDRRDKPFVAVNCAALPKDLLESELFGYEEGTFTGARKGGKMGLFEIAHGGTIFLDEIAEIPLDLQAQLLRVLQEKEIRRLGSDKIIPVNVRVISATNKNLEEEVQLGRFRRDLYYRINVLKLDIPPLRDRKEDIFEIGVYFLRKKFNNIYSRSTDLWKAVLRKLTCFPWYGNIRELENVIERLAVMHDQNILNLNNCERLINEIVDAGSVNKANYFEADSEESEKRMITDALVCSNWCRVAAAKKLGISRATLWRKMKKYQIDTP